MLAASSYRSGGRGRGSQRGDRVLSSNQGLPVPQWHPQRCDFQWMAHPQKPRRPHGMKTTQSPCALWVLTLLPVAMGFRPSALATLPTQPPHCRAESRSDTSADHDPQQEPPARAQRGSRRPRGQLPLDVDSWRARSCVRDTNNRVYFSAPWVSDASCIHRSCICNLSIQVKN